MPLSTALKTQIQVESGQVPLEVEVGKIFGHSKAQVKASYLDEVRREKWGGVSLVMMYLANPEITPLMSLTEPEVTPSGMDDTLFTSGLLSISQG